MNLASRLPPVCLALFAAACAPAPEGGDAADVGDAAGAQADAPAAAATDTADSPAGQASAAGYFEWPEYRANLAAQRYSPLDQVNRDNVADLRVAWRWYAGNYGPRPEQRNETTPLMVNGVLYATVGTTRNVVAIDPATGETLWVWRPDEGDRYENAPRRSSGRGLSYWSDGQGSERLIVVTPGFNLVALDPGTGRQVPGFGENGMVDMFVGLRGEINEQSSIGNTSPAIIVGDTIVVGPAHAVGMRPPSRANLKGDVRGFDARTGQLLWTFRTIPEPGEPGYETWLEGSAEYTGNAGVWAPMAADEELGLVYLPTEIPTGDMYGGHRPGDNLYANSLVAVDARTGEVAWHYQLIHHDIWDWDNPTAPILMDITVDGEDIKAVAQITKQAWVYTFDRETGEPVWPIEERVVGPSDVPGERTALTQPFPTKPPPFDRQGFSEDDLIDFTPALRAEAIAGIEQFRMGPIYTPPSLANAPDGTRGTLMLPSATGGANWEGGAYDPETGILYVGSYTNAWVMAIQPGAGRLRHALYTRRRRGVAMARRPAARQTALGQDLGHRHEPRRDPLAGPERPDAGRRRQQPGARGPRHSGDGLADASADARDRDAVVFGAGLGRPAAVSGS